MAYVSSCKTDSFPSCQFYKKNWRFPINLSVLLVSSSVALQFCVIVNGLFSSCKTDACKTDSFIWCFPLTIKFRLSCKTELMKCLIVNGRSVQLKLSVQNRENRPISPLTIMQNWRQFMQSYKNRWHEGLSSRWKFFFKSFTLRAIQYLVPII